MFHQMLAKGLPVLALHNDWTKELQCLCKNHCPSPRAR